MLEPTEKLIYAGRSGSACDPDDGSGAAFTVNGERWFAVEYETRPGDAGRASYVEELHRG